MGFLDYFSKHPLLDKILCFLVGAFCSLNRIFYTGKGNNSKNILVVSLHRIGDTVFTVPSIRFLYEKYGDNLIMACYPESAKIYKLVFNRIRCIEISREEFKYGGRGATSTARAKLKQLRPEEIFDITGAILSITAIMGIRTRRSYGMTNKYFLKFYSKSGLQRSEPHLIDLYFDTVNLAYAEADVKKYREFEPEPLSEGPVLIHPFAGWKAKEWKIEKILRLLKELSAEYKSSLICEKGQLDEVSCRFIKDNSLILTETMNFDELIENIKQCSVFIGSDSGPLYIATLLGKPTFCIYSATNPDYSFQFGPNYRYVRKKIDCSPLPGNQYCSLNGGMYGCKSFECMNQLEYETVYEKIKDFLKELKN